MLFFNLFIFQIFQQEPEIQSGQAQSPGELVHHKANFDGYVTPDQGALRQMSV